MRCWCLPIAVPFPARPGRGRLLGFALLAWFAAAPLPAQPTIRALTAVIEGHQVGGVTIDLVGNLYVGDFGDVLWKITPEGARSEFASGFYGSSGNAVDAAGNVWQANFYGDSILKLDRKGQPKLLVDHGLNRPVGIAIDAGGAIYVANCAGNFVARIAADAAAVTTFARSDLFKCPNGIAGDRAGNLYVVNFRDNRMLKIDARGAVAPFATISKSGLGHVCFKDDRFYVTAYESHELYEVTLAGAVRRLLGNGERGLVDGGANVARLSFPNGVACDPWERRLYINEYVNESSEALPRRAIVRVVDLGARQ